MLMKPNTAPITVHVTTVTPEMAALWLETNIANRAINRRSVEQFTADMKSGTWLFTGDMIRFDKSGHLIDGQHRLTACVAAGVPFRTYVGHGFDDDIQAVVDTGRSRNNSDVVTMAGIANASIVAATLRILVNEKRGTSLDGGTKTTTNADIKAALVRHPKLPNYTILSRTMPVGISCAIVTYLNYVGSEFLYKADVAQRMVEVLHTGVPSYDHDVMHLLRERLVMGKSKGQFLSYGSKFQLFKKAWNMFALNKPSRHLQVPSGDVEIDGFHREWL